MVSLKPLLALSAAALVVTACSGRIDMRKLSDQQMNDTEHKIHGVIVYQPALFAEISAKTTLIVDGKLRGNSGDNPPACIPVQAEKLVALPDLKNPYLITYDPGLFDSNTFGVSLHNGVLGGVNSNPAAPGESAAASLGSSLSSLPPIPTPLGVPLSSTEAPFGPGFSAPMVEQIQVRSNLPACNDGPVIVGYRRVVLP
jgi:hypothetical protein